MTEKSFNGVFKEWYYEDLSPEIKDFVKKNRIKVPRRSSSPMEQKKKRVKTLKRKYIILS